MFLAIETNDILVCTNSVSLEKKLMKQIQSAFKVTVQKGDVISFLNYRIIQSVHRISVGQTAHILEMVDNFLDKNEKVSPNNTPLSNDKHCFMRKYFCLSLPHPQNLNPSKENLDICLVQSTVLSSMLPQHLVQI